jgi:glucose-1-phosphate cytidylyltransferase
MESMDVVILCGGKGTRLSEETTVKPKPMVEIGGKPILWHIMKYYSSFGHNNFILALGYKSSYIKEYFYNSRFSQNDFTINSDPTSEVQFHNLADDNKWNITFIDTGLETLKGARIKRIEKYVKTENFHLTYGDGLSNVDLKELVEFHIRHKKTATVTAVRPPSRFGEMTIDRNNVVEDFEEKSQMNTGYINGGFFVLNKSIMDQLVTDPMCDFEFGPMQDLAKSGKLVAFKHDGFWQCMDNVRERDFLNSLVIKNQAPWVKW